MRFWEIDFCRGLAVIAMIAFNWLYALGFFGLISFNANELVWWITARVIGFSFIFIAGVSFYLASEKNKNLLQRGAKVFFAGLLVTVVTWVFVPKVFVVFGVLHLIGVSMILALFFKRFSNRVLLAAGALIALIGFVLPSFSFDYSWFLWLGLMPHTFSTLDYFPLLPWFSVFLFGIVFARIFYFKAKRRFIFPEKKSFLLGVLGKNSLALYLLHIPFLLFLLYFFGFNFLK
ncbi:MAG: heparan-alpha-glucosaminide N-acetyltransferase [Candidatus Micrarchaeota archaeon]